MNKFKDYIAENKPQIAIAALGVLAAGALVYWFNKKQKKL